jgi:NIMA-interacting peptidyl-prolyl cis-trans isomerase 1
MLRPVTISLLVSLAARASCSDRARPVTTPDPSTQVADDRDAAAPQGPREIAARHVLVMHTGSERAPESITRTREQAQARALEVLRRARAGESIATLAAEFSDEPGAGERGGSLGRFRRGRMVRAFEDAVFALEVNAISDVIETDFGFHVIQRTE